MSTSSTVSYRVHFMSTKGVCVSKITVTTGPQSAVIEYLGPNGSWRSTAGDCWTDNVNDLVKNLIRLEGLVAVQRSILSLSIFISETDIDRYENQPEPQPVKRILDLTKE